MKILRTAVVCAILDAAVAYILADRSGETQSAMLWTNAGFGAVLGFVTALVLGVLIIRMHSLGYIFGVALLIALLVLAAYLATATDKVVAAALLAAVIPLYALAAVITFITIHPPNPSRPSSR